MPLPKERSDEIYTYADYLSWGENDNAELIDGIRYVEGQRCDSLEIQPNMLAKPSIAHQRISRNLLTQMNIYLEGKQCEVFAEIDVLLPLHNEKSTDKIKNVFSPDITLVCDKDKLKKNYCLGTPDMVMEILSPSTAAYDALTKLDKYQQAGVKEYWIVDPEEKTVRVYLLEGDFYKTPGLYLPPDRIKVSVLEDCTIDLSNVFAE